MRMDILPPTARTADRHRPVDADARLRFDASACLPVRFPGQECGLCADACPIGIIHLVSGHPDFGAGCIGCGQCGTACPTGALSIDGFALPPVLPHEEGPIQVDCWRVPFADSPRGALSVPCLAGIGVGWLLALFELAAAREERTIELLDRGACGECMAGTGMATLRSALREVRELLDECGVTEERLPRFVPLPARGPLAPGIPTTAGEIRMDRRGFFRALVGSVARGADGIATARDTADTPIVLRDNIAPLEHMRTVTALTAIAARHGRMTPARVLPMATLAECGAHGICAKVCPTGALVREERDGTAELKFFAARCIACGQCARGCPDKALRVAASGGGAVVEILARWQARECVVCGEAFFGATGDTCPACRKNQDLLEGAAALFG